MLIRVDRPSFAKLWALPKGFGELGKAVVRTPIEVQG